MRAVFHLGNFSSPNEDGETANRYYARRRRRRASANPASPANSTKPLAVSTTPLSVEVADPPAPVPGAPEGTGALGRLGAVVGTVGASTVMIVVIDGAVVVVTGTVEVVVVGPGGGGGARVVVVSG